MTAARPGQGDVHGNGTARIHSDRGNVAVRHSGGSVDPDGPRARAGVGCDVHVAIVAAHIHRVAGGITLVHGDGRHPAGNIAITRRPRRAISIASCTSSGPA